MTKTKGSRGYRRHEKPPYSYITLIAMAIKAQPAKKATLQQINDWLISNFQFFRGEYNGWKNSVRHNLSLNDCFTKILRDPSRPWGKDNYWTISAKCSYIFKDGAFRRRKKIKDENLKTRKFTPFSIDWILALPSARPVSPARSDGLSDSSLTSSPPSSPFHDPAPNLVSRFGIDTKIGSSPFPCSEFPINFINRSRFPLPIPSITKSVNHVNFSRSQFSISHILT